MPLTTLAAAPTAFAPVVHVKPLASLGQLAVPLTVSWPPATPHGGTPIARYELQMRRDQGAWTPVALPSPLTRSVTVKQPAWATLSFRVRAFDPAKSASGWALSAPVWLSTAQEYDTALTLTPGWQLVSRAGAFGGGRALTTQQAESATFRFSGREVAWVARKGPDSGTARVMIDGKDPASINLYQSTSADRLAVFTAILPVAGLHTLSITTTKAAAKVDIDAFVVLSDPTTQTLVGAGDIATCAGTGDSDTAKVAAGVPGIVFTAGDNVYPDGSPQNFANCYDPAWGPLKARTRPVVGNHDYYNSPGAAGYFAYFGAAAGDPQKGWYKYDAGTWRIYALNSECSASTCPQQYDWLKQDLAAEAHKCTLAIWHRPRFSTGPHGNATDMSSIWSLLATSGSEVVVNGHDHDYERYTPLGPNGYAQQNGLREFVIGTGGVGHYQFTSDSPLVEVRDNTSFCVLRLGLAPGSYSWHFLPTTAAGFTDGGTGTCH